MVVTALKQQEKNQSRVSIYVDGEYSFSLKDSELLDAKLKVGTELAESDIVNYKALSARGKLYDRALRYIAIRERSSKEAIDYLLRKEATDDEARQIVAKLQEKNYVNDERFARMWVDNRLRLKGTSTAVLKRELIQKGIAKDVISLVISENTDADTESLKKLIIKKRRQTRYHDPLKLKMYLVRQGFSYDLVSRALEEAVE